MTIPKYYKIIESDSPQKAITMIDICLMAKFSSSRKQARELIKNGGFYINNTRVTDFDRELTIDDFLNQKYVFVRKGKSDYWCMTFNNLESML